MSKRDTLLAMVQAFLEQAERSPGMSTSPFSIEGWKLIEEALRSSEAVGRSAARRLVDVQAEDAGLWFDAQTVTEAYLQAALRLLHAAVEHDAASHDAPEGQDGKA